MPTTKAPTVARGETRAARAGSRLALIADAGTAATLTKILAATRIDVDTYDDVDTALDAFEVRAPSLTVVFVLDVAPSGLKRITAILEAFPQTDVVMVCPRIGRWELRAAIAAGIAGVVEYENAGSALAACVRAVRSGQVCVPRIHGRQVDPPPLSSREKQILGLVVMGFMNSQIASQLCVAESTVKSHLSSAFGKLGVRSRNEAVSMILDRDTGLGMGILELGGTPLS